MTRHLSAATFQHQAPPIPHAYRAAWADFVNWCNGKQYASLPATSATIAAYCSALADAGAKPATIAQRIAAISKAHRAYAETLPDEQKRTFDNPISGQIVKSTMAGIKRTLTTAQTKKQAITSTELKKIVKAMPDTNISKRDKAMLLLGFAAALRRSEIVALDVNDIRIDGDSVTVTIRQSKTDQTGAGYQVVIPCSDSRIICPIQALRDWMKLIPTSGALFQSMDTNDMPTGKRLTDRVVALRIKHYAEVVGLDERQFAGHSLRSGLITTAYANDVAEGDIQAISRHKNSNILRGYNRNKATNQARTLKAVLR